MLPLPFASRARNHAGFTLIELLVVIAIIAILAGISLSVLSKAQTEARKVQAVNDIRNAKTALVSYYTDYRKYPLNSAQTDPASAAPSGDASYGAPGNTYTSADLFDILRAVPDGNQNPNNVLNPNQVVYWSGGFVKIDAKPTEGITTQDVTVAGKTIPKGSLVDPWGNSYIFFFDANKDGDLSLIIGTCYQNMPVGTVTVSGPPLGFAICSMGADGTFGTKGNGILLNSDDIVSW